MHGALLVHWHLAAAPFGAADIASTLLFRVNRYLERGRNTLNYDPAADWWLVVTEFWLSTRGQVVPG